MKKRLLLAYLNEDNVKCLHLVEEDRISMVLTEISDAEITIAYKEIIPDWKDHHLIIQHVQPGTDNILDFENVSSTAFLIDIEDMNIQVPAWKFIEESLETPDSLKEFTGLLFDILDQCSKTN